MNHLPSHSLWLPLLHHRIATNRLSCGHPAAGELGLFLTFIVVVNSSSPLYQPISSRRFAGDPESRAAHEEVTLLPVSLCLKVFLAWPHVSCCLIIFGESSLVVLWAVLGSYKLCLVSWFCNIFSPNNALREKKKKGLLIIYCSRLFRNSLKGKFKRISRNISNQQGSRLGSPCCSSWRIVKSANRSRCCAHEEKTHPWSLKALKEEGNCCWYCRAFHLLGSKWRKGSQILLICPGAGWLSSVYLDTRKGYIRTNISAASSRI